MKFVSDVGGSSRNFSSNSAFYYRLAWFVTPSSTTGVLCFSPRHRQAEKAAEPKTEEKKEAKPAAKKGGKEKGAAKEPEVVQLGPPGVAPGELVFGVAHIFASFNDTFVVRFSLFLEAQAGVFGVPRKCLFAAF